MTFAQKQESIGSQGHTLDSINNVFNISKASSLFAEAIYHCNLFSLLLKTLYTDNIPQSRDVNQTMRSETEPRHLILSPKPSNFFLRPRPLKFCD